MSALFAGVFLCIATLDAKRRAARWFAASFLCGMVYFLLEFASAVFGPTKLLGGSTLLPFLVALLLLNIGLARHYAIPVPRRLLATVFVIGVAMIVTSQLLPRNSLPSLILYQLPYAMMQGVSAWIVLANCKRRPLNLALGIACLVSSLHFLAKPYIAVLTGRVNDVADRYLETSYALYSQSLGSVMASGIALLLIIVLVRDLLDAMARRARTDSLSGLLNRGAFYERLNERLAEHEANGLASALIICDLDHFKSINDSYGHACGDRVIAEFAAILSDMVGEEGDVGRIGGEEFAILLPERNLEQARCIAEMIRQSFQELDIPDFPMLAVLSASFGVAELKSGENASETIGRADEAMYHAKASGRNCVSTACAPRNLALVAGGPFGRRSSAKPRSISAL